MNKRAFVAGILWVSLLLNGCSDDGQSREDQIKAFIESGVDAAESRSTSDLTELIDEKYLDDRSLNKTQLSKLVRLYFFRHKNIYLFTKLDEIEFLTENEALVTLNVAMAGSVISDVTALTSLSARIYKFELELIKKDKWLLRRARWQPAGLGEIQ